MQTERRLEEELANLEVSENGKEDMEGTDKTDVLSPDSAGRTVELPADEDDEYVVRRPFNFDFVLILLAAPQRRPPEHRRLQARCWRRKALLNFSLPYSYACLMQLIARLSIRRLLTLPS